MIHVMKLQASLSLWHLQNYLICAIYANISGFVNVIGKSNKENSLISHGNSLTREQSAVLV